MPRRHPLIAQWYADYLASPRWRARRQRLLDKRGAVCEDCRRGKKGLTLHHITYARVRRERDRDLRILCPWCHKRAHRTHDIPFLFMCYRPLTRENQAIFTANRGAEDFEYPRMRFKSDRRKQTKEVVKDE